MKLIYIKLSILVAAFISLTSCSSDDDNNSDALTGENNVSLEFDNSMNGDDLILGTSTYTNSNDETLTINRLNYIVSNFVLIDEEGNEFIYPKDESYFVISEENALNEVVLTNIPAGKYVQMRFGVGVDQEKYQQGAEGQGDFLQIAEENNMMWAWQAGYKFLNFEGTFTAPSIASSTDFKIHMGSHGNTLDNYKEVTVNLPSTAMVSNEMTPLIHLEIDANQILDGEHKIYLSEAPVVMVDEVKSPQIAENTSTMFEVHHVHNGEGGHH